jgi:hypothetical protein
MLKYKCIDRDCKVNRLNDADILYVVHKSVWVSSSDDDVINISSEEERWSSSSPSPPPLPYKSTCYSCLVQHPSQWHHMGPGGCCIPSSSDDDDENNVTMWTAYGRMMDLLLLFWGVLLWPQCVTGIVCVKKRTENFYIYMYSGLCFLI